MFKFLFQSSNIVARTAAQFAVVGLAGSIGVSVAATSASANLDAIATNTTPQSISTGILSLTQAPTGSSLGFGKNITGMVPGDSLGFNITLTNGAVAGQNLKLSIADGGNTPLTRDSTNSLQVQVLQCSVAWSGSSCSGTTSTALSNTPVLGMNTSASGSAVALTGLSSITANNSYYLRFIVTLPSGISEQTINGATPTSTMFQGKTASITWTLIETQLAGSLTEG